MVVVVNLPLSFVGYPINEAGVYTRYLRLAGFTTRIHEWNLDFFSYGKYRLRKYIDAVEQISTEIIHKKYIGHTFDIDENELYLYDLLNTNPQLGKTFIEQIEQDQPDIVCYLVNFMRTPAIILKWLMPFTELVANYSPCKQVLIGHGIKELPSWAYDKILHNSALDGIHTGEEDDLPRFLNNKFKNNEITDEYTINEFPDLSDYRLCEYLNNSIGTNIINIYSSRGCNGSCIFCHERNLFPKWKIRSADNVVEEVNYLNKKYNVRIFRFSDALVNINKGRLLKLAEAFIKLGNNEISWVGMLKLHHEITSNDAKLLYKSGCRALWGGIETGDEGIINLIGKNIDLNLPIKIADVLMRNKITFVAFFISNAPWDTKQTIFKTNKYIEKLKNTMCGFLVSPFRYPCKSIMWEKRLFDQVIIGSRTPIATHFEIKDDLNPQRFEEMGLLKGATRYNYEHVYRINGMPIITEL